MMCVRESECEGAGIFIYYNFCHVRIPRLGGDPSGRLKYANTSLSILRTLVFQSCVCACVRHVCVKINAFFHVGESKGEIAKESEGARARENTRTNRESDRVCVRESARAQEQGNAVCALPSECCPGNFNLYT